MSKPKAEVKVQVSRNGPYLVTGSVPLARQTIHTDEEGGSHDWKQGETFPAQDSYALCRCGASINKPFCDGSHASIKFRDKDLGDAD
jgi:CDGSH-type Zn-finger protein